MYLQQECNKSEVIKYEIIYSKAKVKDVCNEQNLNINKKGLYGYSHDVHNVTHHLVLTTHYH